MTDDLETIGPRSGGSPLTYTLTEPGTVDLQSAFASFNGSAASGSFRPTVTIRAQNGTILARVFPSDTLAAGDSADVTFAPFLGDDGGASGPALGTAVVTEQTFGQASAVGTSADAAHADHTHGTPPTPSVTLASIFPAFVSGYWQASQFCVVGSTATPLVGDLHASPFYVPTTTTFDRIAVFLTTITGATSLTRLGIYADNGAGFPGALTLDAGTVTGASAAERSIVINQQLTAGLWWLVGVNQGAGAANTSRGHTFFTHIFTTRTALSDLTPLSSGYIVLRSATTGALPSPFGAGSGYIGTASAIRPFLRAA